MILHGEISISGKKYEKGSYISPWNIYPFFLIHMLGFGASGFLMAYFSNTPVGFIYLHGGLAIFIYLMFYTVIFGNDEIKWMLINSILGVFGLYTEISILLSFADKDISSFPVYRHIIPFIYYVLYTFLLRQFIIDITRSRENKIKTNIVSYIYVLVSLIIYFYPYIREA